MIERYRVTVMRFLAQVPKPQDAEYVPIGPDLLTPREMGVIFEALVYSRATQDRDEVRLGMLEGAAILREGVASIYSLKIDCTTHDEDGDMVPLDPITPRFLERLGITELGYAVAARCSLTRWQDAHYVVETGPLAHVGLLPWWEAKVRGERIPVSRPPKPVHIDGDGVPWYRVQVVADPARLLSRQKRVRITPDFLQGVWAAYSAAGSAGEPTTQAVREWAELRTGRTPSKPTIFRWIKEARELYGQERDHAEDE